MTETTATPAEGEQLPSMDSVKREWTEKLNALTVERKVLLQHPSLHRILRRSYQNTARNAFFIAVYAPAILKKQEAIEAAQEHIKANFRNVTAKLDAELKRAQKLLDGTATDEATFASNRHASPEVFRVPSQVSMLQLRLFEKADQLLVAMQTLWINGDISDTDHQKTEVAVKKALRGSSLAVRLMFVNLLKRSNAANNADTIATRAAKEAGVDGPSARDHQEAASADAPAPLDADVAEEVAVAA